MQPNQCIILCKELFIEVENVLQLNIMGWNCNAFQNPKNYLNTQKINYKNNFKFVHKSLKIKNIYISVFLFFK